MKKFNKMLSDIMQAQEKILSTDALLDGFVKGKQREERNQALQMTYPHLRTENLFHSHERNLSLVKSDFDRLFYDYYTEGYSTDDLIAIFGGEEKKAYLAEMYIRHAKTENGRFFLTEVLDYHLLADMETGLIYVYDRDRCGLVVSQDTVTLLGVGKYVGQSYVIADANGIYPEVASNFGLVPRMAYTRQSTGKRVIYGEEVDFAGYEATFLSKKPAYRNSVRNHHIIATLGYGFVEMFFAIGNIGRVLEVHHNVPYIITEDNSLKNLQILTIKEHRRLHKEFFEELYESFKSRN